MKRFSKFICISLAALVVACGPDGVDTAAFKTEKAFEEAKLDQVLLRQFLTGFPKGGDLHTHSFGAVYAEVWLDWAAEDGLCVDSKMSHIKMPSQAGCEGEGIITAAAARDNETIRRNIINTLSMRSFVPSSGWSGHDQFFATFAGMAMKPERFGDMLAQVSHRAGEQNISYLEIMHTLELENIFPTAIGVKMTGDPAIDYAALMDSPFGAALPDMVSRARSSITDAKDKQQTLLLCDSDAPKAGCDVEVRLLHQVIRELPLPVVYGQIILGWNIMAADDQMVGLNLVAPEDGYVALRDYTTHMKQIDHLYQTLGAQNVTLHAGELALGLVRTENLRFHIKEAIELGHAKRIGHGMDIAYETDSEALLAKMAAEEIMVEINLTSNDRILGIKDGAHPLLLYREAGVPMALSTDDEGVSRIDLTHEFVRGVMSYDFSYQEIKDMSRNALKYSFLPDDEKDRLSADLEQRFTDFEATFNQ